MRLKRTIRKMTPMARKASCLTRAAGSVVKRLEYLTEELQFLTEELQRQEMAAHALGRENIELRARLNNSTARSEQSESPVPQGYQSCTGCSWFGDIEHCSACITGGHHG